MSHLLVFAWKVQIKRFAMIRREVAVVSGSSVCSHLYISFIFSEF